MSEPTVKELFYTPSGDPTDPGGGGGSETDWDNIVDKPSGSSEWQTETGFGTIVTFAGDQNLQTTDDVTFKSGTFSDLTSGRVVYAGASGLLQDSANLTFDGSNLTVSGALNGGSASITGALSASTLRPDTGKFLSPVSYAFRNAGDTGFRAVEMAGLTATTGEFSGNALFQSQAQFPSNSTSEFNFIQGNVAAGGSEAGTRNALWVRTRFDDLVLQAGVDDSNFRDITIRRGLTGNRITVNSNGVGINKNADSGYALDVEGVAAFSDDIGKDDFATGATDFSGTGWQGSSTGDFNIRNLIVRESARFRELIIDQLSIIAGSDLLSVARGKIESIDTGANTITIEDPNDRGATRFVLNDFFWVKSVDIDNSTIVDLKGQVTAVSGTTLTLDTTVTGGTHDGETTDISSLSVGDVVAQRGHPTNADRQSLIYRTVSDSDAPVEKFLDGIDSLGAFDTTDNIVVEIGPTAGHFGANNILTYSPDEVGLASFTADENYLTDGHTYIGAFSEFPSTFKVGIGTNSGGVPQIAIRNGVDSTNRILFRVQSGKVDGIFRNSAGDTVAQFGTDQNFIAGLEISGDLTMSTAAGIMNANEDARFQLRAEGFVVDYLDSGTWQRAMSVGSNGMAIGGSLTAFPSSADFDMFIKLPEGDPVSPNQWYFKNFEDLANGDQVICISEGTESAPSTPAQPSVCKQSNALIISWSAVANADSYDVQRSQDGGAYADFATNVQGLDVADTDPFGSPDDTFQYKVRACNSGGCSTYSTASTSTTFNTASSC